MPPSVAIARGMGVIATTDQHPTGRRVVLSSVSSDSHTWNLVFLQMFLEENGYQVTNLGPCVPDDLLVSVADREQPDAIVISSVNGHGWRDGARVVRALRENLGTRRVPVLIGGKLGIHGASDASRADGLLAAGCDAVFNDDAGAGSLTDFLARLSTCHGGRGRDWHGRSGAA
jgi:methylaspartate mutase sigma subunit